MIVILPLQATWGAVAINCTHHEEGVAAQHFGHHTKTNSDSATDAGSDDAGKLNIDTSYDSAHHNDCEGGGEAVIFTISLTFIAPSGQTHCYVEPFFPQSTIISSRIERPKWNNLA